MTVLGAGEGRHARPGAGIDAGGATTRPALAAGAGSHLKKQIKHERQAPGQQLTKLDPRGQLCLAKGSPLRSSGSWSWPDSLADTHVLTQAAQASRE